MDKFKVTFVATSHVFTVILSSIDIVTFFKIPDFYNSIFRPPFYFAEF